MHESFRYCRAAPVKAAAGAVRRLRALLPAMMEDGENEEASQSRVHAFLSALLDSRSAMGEGEDAREVVMCNVIQETATAAKAMGWTRSFLSYLAAPPPNYGLYTDPQISYLA